MTIVKCNLKDCDYNQEGICRADEIELNDDADIFECYTYENNMK